MSIAYALLAKATPLYFVILLGYIAGKRLPVDTKTVSYLLMYIIGPAVFFYAALTVKFSIAVLGLPILFFTISAFLCFSFLKIGELFFTDATKNILAFGAGNGNTGYFGISIATLLFSSDIIGLYIMSMMGVVLHQNSIGFYIAARGKHSVREAFIRTIRLPSLHLFSIGLILNYTELSIAPYLHDLAQNFKGAYSTFGMMLIGLGLSAIKEFKLDWTYISLAFIAKFVCWPAIVAIIIFLDSLYFGLISKEISLAMYLISIVPMAADTVAFATTLDAKPEKAAAAVLLSTIFALVYMPIFIALVGFE